MDIINILMTLSSLVVIALPVLFTLFVRSKEFGVLKAALLGVVGFLAGNYGLNMLIDLVAGGALDTLAETHETLANFLICLQQGFVEEIMRFLLMLLCMKNCLEKENSLMYAGGHGGTEMIIRGIGLAAGVVTAVAHPEDSPYEGMPIFSPFLFPLLFGFSFCLHVGLSYLMYRAVKDRKYYLALLALALHVLGNFSTMVEVPLLPLLGPVAVVGGLLAYTIISYRRETPESY